MGRFEELLRRLAGSFTSKGDLAVFKEGIGPSRLPRPADGYVYAGDSSSPTGYTQVEPGPGTFDHGELTGLADDDHLQYYNSTRGDARWVRGIVSATEPENPPQGFVWYYPGPLP